MLWLFGGQLLPPATLKQVRADMWLHGGINPLDFDRFRVPEYRFYYDQLKKHLKAQAEAMRPKLPPGSKR